jgi:O-antigen/teichoic acid export membrane protein
MGIVLARLLEAEGFGWFALIQSTVLMLQGFGALGMGVAATSHIARTRHSDPGKAGRIISFSVLFTLLSGGIISMLILATPIATIQSCLGTKESPIAAKLVGPLTLLAMINKIQADVMVGLEAFRQMAIVSMIRAGASITLAAIGAYAFGPVGAVIGLGLAWLLSGLASQIAISIICRAYRIGPVWRDAFGEYRLLKTSMLLAVSSLALAMVNWIMNTLMARQDGGLMELAIFSAADRWRTAILFVPGLLAQVSLPMFAYTHARSEARTCMRLLMTAGTMSLVSTAIWFASITLVGPVMMATYGPSFVKGNKVLQILAIGCLPAGMNMVGAYFLWATGRAKTMLMVDLVRALVTLFYCLLQVPLSALDAARGLSLGYAVSTPLLICTIWPVVVPGKKEILSDNR